MDQYKEIELVEKIKVDNVRDIRAIYDKLVSNEINEQDKLDGELFRKNFVGVHDGSTNKYIHVGLQPETKIVEYIGEMLTFLKYLMCLSRSKSWLVIICLNIYILFMMAMVELEDL